MKKNVISLVLCASLFVTAGACKTTGGGKSTGSGGGDSSEPITTQFTTPEEANDALQKVYNTYRDDLILDGATFYTVKSGDTLSRIARDKYKDGFYFPVIMLASSKVVLDLDKIDPGMELTIPDLNRNLDDPQARASIKKFLGDIAGIEDRRGRPQDAKGLRDLADTL